MSKYRDVADALRIRIGPEFAVGDRLPSISTLQEQYDVRGLNTVRDALRVLSDEGLVRTEHGRGSFVTALPAPRRPVDAARDDVLRIAGVPRDTRNTLAARASAEGLSLETYLLRLLTREAAVPTTAEVLDRSARRSERAARSAVDALRAERNAR